MLLIYLTKPVKMFSNIYFHYVKFVVFKLIIDICSKLTMGQGQLFTNSNHFIQT